MSYDPSRRPAPPPQERWPQATPEKGWPAYREADAQGQDAYRRQAAYQASSHGAAPQHVGPDPVAGYGNGYADGGYGARHAGGYRTGARDGWDGSAGGWDRDAGGREQDRRSWEQDIRGGEQESRGWGQVAESWNPSDDEWDRRANAWARETDLAEGYGWDAYADQGDAYAGSRDVYAGSGYGYGYLAEDDYYGSGADGLELVAPDAGLRADRWGADRWGADRWGTDRWGGERGGSRRGVITAALSGFLAAAVAVGVSTLAAAFVRPQASPVVAVGDMLLDRVPLSLRHVVAGRFGGHERVVLLLGMVVAITILAVVAGLLTRHAAALGVAWIAAFTLVGAFATITGPGGRLIDVIPSVAGGLAGILALVVLDATSAPVRTLQRDHDGGRGGRGRGGRGRGERRRRAR